MDLKYDEPDELEGEESEGPEPPPINSEDSAGLSAAPDQPYDVGVAMEARVEKGRAAAELIFWDIANCSGSSHAIPCTLLNTALMLRSHRINK